MFPAELLLLNIPSMDKVLFQSSQAGKEVVPAGRNPSSSLKNSHKPRVHLILHMEINQGKVPLSAAWNRGWERWEELVVSEFLGCSYKQGLLVGTILSQLDHPLCSTLKMLLLTPRCLLPQTSWILLDSMQSLGGRSTPEGR